MFKLFIFENIFLSIKKFVNIFLIFKIFFLKNGCVSLEQTLTQFINKCMVDFLFTYELFKLLRVLLFSRMYIVFRSVHQVIVKERSFKLKFYKYHETLGTIYPNS